MGLVGFPLGVALRALDEMTALAPTTPRAGAMEPIADDPAEQVQLAAAQGDVRAARSFVFDTVGSVWDTALAGAVPSLEQRANLQLAAQQAMHAVVGAVDLAVALTGVGAIHAGHPLQRRFRDIHTGAQLADFSPAALKRFTKVRLGIDQPLHLL